MPAVGLDNALHNGQSQPRACILGCVERIQKLCNITAETCSAVGKAQINKIVFLLAADSEGAVLFHCLLRVDKNIINGAVHKVSIAAYAQAFRQVNFCRNIIFCKGCLQKAPNFLHNLSQIDNLIACLPRPRIIQKVRHRGIQAL